MPKPTNEKEERALAEKLKNEAKSRATKSLATPPIGSKGKTDKSVMPMASPSSFKKGGKVKKTGMALVHKGERVQTRKQQRNCK